MLKLKRYIVLVICLLTSLSFNAQNTPTLSPDAEISLLTCSPGEELYALFGHSAIRVSDPAQRIDVVYNYGTFSFDEDFYYNFTMGKLNYMLSRSSTQAFVQSYHREGRGVSEQVLALDSGQRQSIFDFLEWNQLPSNRYYLYDFFYDNCSSRIRDVLDSTLEDQGLEFPDLTVHGSPSFRNLIDLYLVYHPWGDFGIDLGLGLPCDKVMDSEEYMFLPDELERAFDGATLANEPLVKESRTLLEAPKMARHWSWTDPVPLFWIIAGLFVTLSGIGLRRGRRWAALDYFYLLTIGAVGTLIFFLWFITDHTATASNLNILWAWPTHWLALFFLHVPRFRNVYWTTYGIVLLLTLISFPLLPQMLHLATVPIVLMGLTRAFVNWRIQKSTA